MKILAVDDEKLALDSMADAIREASPEAELFTFQKPKEVLAWAEKTQRMWLFSIFECVE